MRFTDVRNIIIYRFMFTDRRGIFWVQYIAFNNQVTGRKRIHISIIGPKVDIENAFK